LIINTKKSRNQEVVKLELNNAALFLHLVFESTYFLK